MGTTLTGTTPQDTYDSLIKVTDNGPLSGSLKKLTDGLGNDSSLSLSTTAASFSGTLAVSGASTFSSAITMALGGTPRLTLQDTDGGAGNVGILFKESTNDKWTLASNSGNFQFFNEATASNALFISSTNNVGIGTSNPAAILELVGGTSTTNSIVVGNGDNSTIASRHSIVFNVDRNNDIGGRVIEFRYGGNGYGGGTAIARFTSAGLCFGNDYAAANALDDYEEGTFTPTLTASTSNPTVTYATGNTGGIYTKIGNQVTASFEVRWTALSSGSGNVRISGLPFTRRTTTQPDGERCVISSRLNTIDGVVLIGTVTTNQTFIELEVEKSVTANAPLTVADLATTGTAFLRATVTYFV